MTRVVIRRGFLVFSSGEELESTGHQLDGLEGRTLYLKLQSRIDPANIP